MAGETVLIVDDNNELAENLAELLGLEGFEPLWFGHPEQALEWAQVNSFALALLDVRMPIMDGLSLYDALRRRHPTARFVFVTAYGEDRTQEFAAREGLDVISKPIDEDFLLARIAALIRGE